MWCANFHYREWIYATFPLLERSEDVYVEEGVCCRENRRVVVKMPSFGHVNRLASGSWFTLWPTAFWRWIRVECRHCRPLNRTLDRVAVCTV